MGKNNTKDSLGDRMKTYESCSKNYLTRRMPVIIRLDGKAFHTLTRKLEKPYDIDFRDLMLLTAKYLVGNVMNCKLAYVQSDEISLLLVDYGTLQTDAWFSNNVQKMVSVSASMATAKFNSMLNVPQMFPQSKRDDIKQEFAMFDSRVFNLPREEVVNSFVWRQQDATRNSIQGLGQKYYSQKQLNGKSCNKIQDMLMLDKSINWNNVDTYFKRGGCVTRDGIDLEIPIFTQDRSYIDQYLNPDEE